MNNRIAEITRETTETSISLKLMLDGTGIYEVDTQIPFFNHMLNLFSAHSFFNLFIKAKGDIEVDFHHTVEDAGLVLGEAFDKALGAREGIKRYGYAATPMDEALSYISVDLSKRPYLVYNICDICDNYGDFDIFLTKEFLKAFVSKGGLNLHVNVPYGENKHHVIEAVFKGLGRALSEAVSFDKRIKGVKSTKGVF
ncbi:MAG: imidazoleglycerol-phosphate dehydratase HisB [Deltaproteobacteria bacterium]|nr:imidazoleglycerol-phosphate dehydratase HisB [Deltaproteobacteria bacterium]